MKNPAPASRGRVLLVKGHTDSEKQTRYLKALQDQVEQSEYLFLQTELPARPGGPQERLKLAREVWATLLSQRWNMILVDGHRDGGTLDTLVRGLELGDIDGDLRLRGKKIQTDLLVVGSCWSMELAPKLGKYVEGGAHVMLWRNASPFSHGFDVYPSAFKWVFHGCPDPGTRETALRLRGHKQIEVVAVRHAEASPENEAGGGRSPQK